MKLPLTVVILTYNEELNLESCLKSLKNWADEIFVVDSYSTDGTAQIAKRYNAKFIEHPFENQARQFNWVLDNLDIKSDWILRLDADERLTKELWQEIADVLSGTAPDVSGFYMKRRVYFMGRWIRHGGYYPTWILRLFRRGKGRSEDREMDEHIILLEGRAESFKNDFIDDNQKNLEFWISKHNNFSSREANEAIKLMQAGNAGIDEKRLGPEVLKKRAAKRRYYSRPPFFRVFIYFVYRYVFLLGFLDGVEGLIFHVLQGFWYRFLVDAKLYEYKYRKSEAQSTKS